MTELTADELRELDAELAKGMGWTLVNDWWCIKAKDFPDSYFDHLFHIDDWRPTKSISQAFEVAIFLAKYHSWFLFLNVNNKDGDINWRSDFVEMHSFERVGLIIESTPALAICLAAREVMRI